jgi:hypothetical protein
VEDQTVTEPTILEEPDRVDEPTAAAAYADVLTQVAAEHRALIVRRNGEDLAAVIPLEHWELVREVLARQAMEQQTARIDWDRARQRLRPPQEWFDGDEPKPF